MLLDLRTCRDCGAEKALDLFPVDRSASLGRSRRCKACNVARVAAWQRQHPARVNAKNSAWRAAHREDVVASAARYRRESKDRVTESKRAWVDRNRTRVRESSRVSARNRRYADPEAARKACRRYYLNHQDKMRERCREQARRDPGAARARAYARRARLKGATVRERVYRSVVWKRDKGVCHICSRPCNQDRWDMDHVVPLSRGGDHSYANIRVSHPSCNNRKRARLIDEMSEVASAA